MPASHETSSKPSAILIVGDLMIDRTWVVPKVSALATSQAHDDVPPRKLIKPLWQTDLLGGLGFILRTIVAADSTLKLYVASAWSDNFNPGDYLFPGNKLPGPINFLRLASTKFNTEKFRVYEQSDKEPKLVQRFDRDLYWDASVYIPLSPHWPSRDEIGVVIVTDFNKGVLDLPNVINELDREYRGKPFFLDAKRSYDHPVFAKLPWTHALPNREEFAKLVGLPPVEVPSFRGAKLNPRLIEGLQEFGQKFKPDAIFVERSVLLKLDREGAVFYEHRANSEQVTALMLPPDESKAAGIGAGDVLVSRLAINTITQVNKSGTCNYVEACSDAVRYATAFCKAGTKVEHLGWYGVDVGGDSELGPDSSLGKKIAFSFQKKEFHKAPVELPNPLVERNQQAASSESMLERKIEISITDAAWFLDGFLTVDRELGKEILRLRSQFAKYFASADPSTKPFVVAICGRPGSGKSALADALSQALPCTVIKGNAAQWTSIEDLFRLCEEIRTVRVNGGKPFVFIDEVDAAVNGEKLYGKLLAPLGDGAYSTYGYIRKLGAAAFLLAGSNEPWNTRKKLTGPIDEKSHPKLHDLVSRFSIPPVEVPPLGDRRMDALYFAAYLLRKRFPGIKNVHRGILKLLSQSTPKHGPRSIAETVSMFGPLKNPDCVTTGDLVDTARDVIHLHLENTPQDWENDSEKIDIHK